MDTLIRVATDEDVQSLFEIRTSVAQNHLSREQMAALGITPQVLVQAMGESECIWIAEIEGQALAFAMIDRETGELFALFVRPGHENRGLGRRLMAVAEAALFEQHERIFLITDGRESIRANGFYQRLGWVVVGQEDNDDVRYEKRRSLSAG